MCELLRWPLTGFESRAGTTTCDASSLGGFVRRYLSTRILRITSIFFRCTMYLVSHSVPCHCLVKQHSRNDKKKKKKGKKDCQMSVYHKADPGELIHWVTHGSRSSAASNSGLIRIGTQPRTADAWHHDSCRPRGVVTRDFSAIFDRLFDRLPVRISTSDLYHWILRKKIFHIRAYDFGVQFSFKWGLFIKMATDWEVSEVGDTCRPAAGPGRGRAVQIEWISAGTAHLGFPALWSVPHLLSREIKMNRRHYKSRESDWTFEDGRFCVHLCIETLCKRPTSVAHLTNFSFEFFYEIFTEDASLPRLCHGAKKSKMTKNSNQGGSCLNLQTQLPCPWPVTMEKNP